MKLLVPRQSFASLSITDLLDAREAYHTHLLHLENVIGTAVGRYRFYRGERRNADGTRPVRERGYYDDAKTLDNSVVAEDSWPCVLVFVKDWIKSAEFGKRYDEIVPPRLYLPDGRLIPTCVLLARRLDVPAARVTNLKFPGNVLGPGFPVLSEVQGTVHVGTLGCLVTDGRKLYGLTNAHVAGDRGSRAYSLVQGEREEVGTADRQVVRVSFEHVYPGYTGKRTLANLDAGLIEINDSTRWTSQVYGIGQFDDLADVNPQTATPDLIGSPVTAYGAVSGRMYGEIAGMFYRYRSMGGTDYVADFLIGPRSEAGNKPTEEDSRRLAAYGNSGAVWFLEQEVEQPRLAHYRGKPRAKAAEPKVRLRPIALHWGGQTFAAAGEDLEAQFALASSLGTICRELDVDIVRDLNTGLPETWGKVGHYKIGQIACSYVTDAQLLKLMQAKYAFTGWSPDLLAA